MLEGLQGFRRSQIYGVGFIGVFGDLWMSNPKP